MCKTIGLITARGGSKGVPQKNIRMLCGKPIIVWTIEAALSASSLMKVIVSTDDETIADICKKHGAEVPFMRPSVLAQDNSSHVDVVEHAIEWCEQNINENFDSMIILQPTSPLRTAYDIDKVAALARKQNANGIVSVCEITQHPYLAKILDDDGTLKDFLPTDIAYKRRQNLPNLYCPNGAIYWFLIDSFKKTKSFFPNPTYPYIMSSNQSLQIDSMEDLYLIDLILKDRSNRNRDIVKNNVVVR